MDPSASISSSSGCSTSIHTKTCSSSRSCSASPSSSSPSIKSPSRNACALIMAASLPQPPAIASRIVPLPEPLHSFWISLDDLVADVLPTPWGAVVTDARFPDVWDTNYARVDVATEVPVATIEADLLPALLRAGVRVEHVVSFHHEAHGQLLAELSARGHPISWDLAMVLDGTPGGAGGIAEDIAVEELPPADELWMAAAGSMRDSFGIEPATAAEQL